MKFVTVLHHRVVTANLLDAPKINAEIEEEIIDARNYDDTRSFREVAKEIGIYL